MQGSMRYLTKSRFKLALSCPTKLYYTGKPEYANTMEGNEFMAMLADGGFQVGELAKLMYPEGHEVKAKGNAEALAETTRLMQQTNVTLFEPAFSVNGCLVRVDILVKRGSSIEVIEVKAKSFDSQHPTLSSPRKSISSEMLPYVQDVAFQKRVVQQAQPECTVTAALMMPDKSKTTRVNGLNQMFKVKRVERGAQVQVQPAALALQAEDAVLCTVSVDHLANEILASELAYPGGKATLPTLVSEWSTHYRNDTQIPPSIGAHCGSCEYKAEPGSDKRSGFHECWKLANQWTDEDFKQGTVLDLWNFRGKQRLLDAGRKKLPLVTADDLNLKESDDGLSNSERQWLQVNGLPEDAKSQGFYLDREGLQAEMSAWKYPLHFIDFETASVALPFHAGRRPYEQVAFQFSHHVMTAEGEVRHQDEFLLVEPGVFPNYAFVRALQTALCTDSGTVLRWSHHENSILNAIKRQLQEDSAPPADADALVHFIDQITTDGPRSMVDLADVARRRFFHPYTRGSSSIKKVLPAVMQSSPFLKATYSTASYGTPAGSPSKNFAGMAWWQTGPDGVLDPYQLLVSPDTLAGSDTDQLGFEINQGGAATNAYMCLQFEDMGQDKRKAMEQALLRYCELDTLAMVMILQAWTSD